MSNLSESLNSNRFVVTCELNPPKGTELDPLYDKADSLKNLVAAFNIISGLTILVKSKTRDIAILKSTKIDFFD